MTSPGKTEQDEHTNRDWDVVWVRSRHEEVVRTQLAGKSFEVFLPKAEVLSRWKDRWKTIERALFPGYLFINTYLNYATNLDIVKTRGVVDILGDGNSFGTPVPAHEVESIKLLLRRDCTIEPHAFLRSGQRIKVVNGPFQGVIGQVTEFRGQSRLVVSVELLARSVSVILDSWDVLPYCDSES